ncbi:MAG: hypothetical protein LH478_00495 [Chitinophagaceae bacterium]|nr:hypothetical protein [Chitinophagaceae bacterium]
MLWRSELDDNKKNKKYKGFKKENKARWILNILFLFKKLNVGKEGLTPGDIPWVKEVDANVLVEKLRTIKSSKLQAYFDYLPQ